MRKMVLMLLLILIPIQSWSETTDISENDGNNWRTWDRVKKVFFIEGYIFGSSKVIKENYDSISDDYNEKDGNQIYLDYYASFLDTIEDESKKILFSNKETKLIIDKETIFKNNRLRRYGIFNITVGQMGDGLDVLYEDFKNRSIPITDAIYVVKKQINGASNDDVERILLYLRSGKTNRKPLMVTDPYDSDSIEKGNFPRIIEFP